MVAPTKKEEKVVVLKGKEADDKVLQYMKDCNRPYGAADVSANIKNVVSKLNTQKILLSLAENDLITSKTYGKTVYFVAKQGNLPDLSPTELEALETEVVGLSEDIKGLTSILKQMSTELSGIRSTPRDSDLPQSISTLETEVEALESLLLPLRSGSPLMSDEDSSSLDHNWLHWRLEWVSRKKVFKAAWGLAVEAISPAEAEELAEELGVEFDSPEHLALEKSDLCQPKSRRRL